MEQSISVVALTYLRETKAFSYFREKLYSIPCNSFLCDIYSVRLLICSVQLISVRTSTVAFSRK